MKIRELAKSYHDNGFNCAQSTLSACREYTSLDEKTGLALAAGLGGGVRCGEICGAVTGGVLAIGAVCPFTDGQDTEAKDKIAALAKAYTAAFREKFGAIRCEEIKTDKHHCEEMIVFAAELAEKFIQENKK